ncbi:MAG: GNAT family N-acetyltransferase [Candidatus Aenigmarchaeota archaeon]|nr:GNAT family N-acetyltransferase [Candidatus Aenigmarchaeota archaeon]
MAEVEKIAELQEKLSLYHKKFDPNFYVFNKNAKGIWVKFAKKLIRNKNGILLVCVNKNRIVGYTLGLIKNKPPVYKIKKFGLISDIFVEKDYRNKGIARKFVTELMRWFKSKQLSYTELTVDSKNRLALKVYNKLGFKEYRKIMKKEINL